MDVARRIETSTAIADRMTAVAVAVTDAPLRVLLAERRASAQSDLSRRLAQLGHEVLARVTSGQGASDYAELLRPDVVLLSPVLEDGVGVLAALGLTRRVVGVAAVVLTDHPAAADPSARPNWGSVAVLPANAGLEDLEFEMRRAVTRARAAAELVTEEPAAATPVAVTPVPRPAAVATRSPEPVVSAPQPRGQAAAPAVDVPVEATRPAVQVDVVALPVQQQPAPAHEVEPAVSMAVPARYDEEMNLIAEAAEALLERTGLSRADAMRLMEQEAADTGQSLIDVARAVLGREGTGAGEELAAVA